MANDDISCVKEVTKNVPITLSISYLANEITGISDVLESWKRQYIQILQGIVVSYKNVSLLSKFAYIQSDCPVIQCNVKATFELFTPSVGSIVKGVINRISHDYIGCLVHNTINVAINRFDNTNDASNFIALDKVILFEITHMGFKRKVIKVKGKITQDCVNLMKQFNFSTIESISSSNNKVIYASHEYSDASNDANDNTESISLFNYTTAGGKTSDYSSDIGSVSPKKKSKKLKKELSISSSHDTITENYSESLSLLDNISRLTAEDFSDISHDSSKKKKKKSRKRDRSELSIDDSSETSSNQINADHNLLQKEVISPKKKKLKKSLSSISERNLFLNINELRNLKDNSSETSSQSSSSKKKKHKKSNKDVLSSPPIFSDSLSSKDEIKPFKMPTTPSKKRKEKSPIKFSPSKNFNSVKSLAETYEDTPSELLTLMSPVKFHQEFSQYADSMTVGSTLQSVTDTHFTPNDSNKDKSLDSAKKAKKRKLESSGKDGSLKKKKKLNTDGSKHKGDKSKKKSKDKSKKDKKKKTKNKVISSKKKLPKLKKKKKDKTGKLKNKTKKSKHKKSDVP